MSSSVLLTNIQATDGAGGTALTWLTQPLAAVTISGTVTLNIRGLEAANTVNAGRGITIERTNASGVVQSTIVNNIAHGTEFTLSDAANAAWTTTPTSTNIASGERIKITLRVRNVGTMGANASGVTYSYNGASASAAGDTWVQFNESVTLNPGAAISTLTDNCDDNSIDAAKWDTAGGSITIQEANQRLEIVPQSSNPASDGYIRSDAVYNLTGDALVVDMASALVATSGAYQFVAVYFDDNNRVAIEKDGSDIRAYKVVATARTDLSGGATYNSSTHRWLRIRESGGTIFCDYASDGTTWNNFGSGTVTFAITRLQVEFHAGTYNSIASPGTAAFDNIGLAPTSAKAPPPPRRPQRVTYRARRF